MVNEGWTEWSKHVLKELERLNDNHENIRDKIAEIQHSIVELRGSGVEELRAWKKDVDDVVSPTQLKELKAKVEELEMYKVKATTAFIVVQGIFGLLLTLSKLI